MTSFKKFIKRQNVMSKRERQQFKSLCSPSLLWYSMKSYKALIFVMVEWISISLQGAVFSIIRNLHHQWLRGERGGRYKAALGGRVKEAEKINILNWKQCFLHLTCFEILSEIENDSDDMLNSLNSIFQLGSAFAITRPGRQNSPNSLYIISASDSEDSAFWNLWNPIRLDSPVVLE